MKVRDSIILNTDSYKHSHFLQYPPNTETVYSYIESRGGQFNKLVMFGLQAFIKKYLTIPITSEDVDFAEKITIAHGLPFNRIGWDYIVNKHNGKLPVIIRALPEGMVVPTHIPVLTIENTDPKCFWLTSFLETSLLRAVWYPSTVATISYHAKQIIMDYLIKTCEDPESQIGFKLHDFGYRGVSSKESGELGGLAHLINFLGTDTMGALVAAIEFYNTETAVGFSIPAAEHSTITSWGREGEVDAYANMVQKFSKPGGLLAVVSDSYDIYNAISNIWGDQLRSMVIECGATVVVRPDSGTPHEVVLECLNRLGVSFGYSVNKLGYKVLPPYIRVIQGDGINLSSIEQILEFITRNGWSSENVAFGMGGMLLQGLNRDTLKWAMKCSAINRDGKWYDVYKDPVTDHGKISKKGRFAVVYEKGIATCKPESGNSWQNELRVVFKNGELLIDDNFESIRKRAAGKFE